jgi:hypothetical protein
MIVIKIINEKNKKLRVQYEIEHKNKFIEEFWFNIHWTNVTHVNRSEISFQ